MPNFSPILQYSENRAQFIGEPVKDIANLNEEMYKRYKTSLESQDLLENTIANLPVLDESKQHVNSALQKAQDSVKAFRDSGKWYNADTTVRRAAKEFSSDKLIKGALASRQNYDNILKWIEEADTEEDKAFGLQMLAHKRALYKGEKLNDKGEVEGGFTMATPAKREDADKDFAEFIKDWKPDTEIEGIVKHTDKNGNTVYSYANTMKRVNGGYFVTNSTERVRPEEVRNAILTKALGDKGLMKQYQEEAYVTNISKYGVKDDNGKYILDDSGNISISDDIRSNLESHGLLISGNNTLIAQQSTGNAIDYGINLDEIDNEQLLNIINKVDINSRLTKVTEPYVKKASYEKMQLKYHRDIISEINYRHKLKKSLIDEYTKTPYIPDFTPMVDVVTGNPIANADEMRTAMRNNSGALSTELNTILAGWGTDATKDTFIKYSAENVNLISSLDGNIPSRNLATSILNSMKNDSGFNGNITSDDINKVTNYIDSYRDSKSRVELMDATVQRNYKERETNNIDALYQKFNKSDKETMSRDDYQRLLDISDKIEKIDPNKTIRSIVPGTIFYDLSGAFVKANPNTPEGKLATKTAFVEIANTYNLSPDDIDFLTNFYHKNNNDGQAILSYRFDKDYKFDKSKLKNNTINELEKEYISYLNEPTITTTSLTSQPFEDGKLNDLVQTTARDEIATAANQLKLKPVNIAGKETNLEELGEDFKNALPELLKEVSIDQLPSSMRSIALRTNVEGKTSTSETLRTKADVLKYIQDLKTEGKNAVKFDGDRVILNFWGAQYEITNAKELLQNTTRVLGMGSYEDAIAVKRGDKNELLGTRALEVNAKHVLNKVITDRTKRHPFTIYKANPNGGYTAQTIYMSLKAGQDPIAPKPIKNDQMLTDNYLTGIELYRTNAGDDVPFDVLKSNEAIAMIMDQLMFTSNTEFIEDNINYKTKDSDYAAKTRDFINMYENMNFGTNE